MSSNLKSDHQNPHILKMFKKNTDIFERKSCLALTKRSQIDELFFSIFFLREKKGEKNIHFFYYIVYTFCIQKSYFEHLVWTVGRPGISGGRRSRIFSAKICCFFTKPIFIDFGLRWGWVPPPEVGSGTLVCPEMEVSGRDKKFLKI